MATESLWWPELPKRRKPQKHENKHTPFGSPAYTHTGAPNVYTLENVPTALYAVQLCGLALSPMFLLNIFFFSCVAKDTQFLDPNRRKLRVTKVVAYKQPQQ